MCRTNVFNLIPEQPNYILKKLQEDMSEMLSNTTNTERFHQICERFNIQSMRLTEFYFELECSINLQNMMNVSYSGLDMRKFITFLAEILSDIENKIPELDQTLDELVISCKQYREWKQKYPTTDNEETPMQRFLQRRRFHGNPRYSYDEDDSEDEYGLHPESIVSGLGTEQFNNELMSLREMNPYPR
ncbi:hypothetical protein SNEBB_004850 [Seison nebaliae]|nr:hypothetical protein SNEBB_004850 [Seison nebaliae]